MCLDCRPSYYRFMLRVFPGTLLIEALPERFLEALRKKRAVTWRLDGPYQPNTLCQRPKGGLSQRIDVRINSIRLRHTRHQEHYRRIGGMLGSLAGG